MTRIDAGGVAVGSLDHLAGWEATLVTQLRCWCDGDQGRTTVFDTFARCFDPNEAERAFAAFEALVTTLMLHAHRPLVRHSVQCSCLGADESVFIHFIRLAEAGQFNDATLVATLMIGATYAEHLTLIAGEVGHTARQMSQYISTPISRACPSAALLH
ncbi:hypothetical protein [Pseudoprimorskyibacter insulae]|nr:hypothetical protein [Pseudoprimorskyibacter insulae]